MSIALWLEAPVSKLQGMQQATAIPKHDCPHNFIIPSRSGIAKTCKASSHLAQNAPSVPGLLLKDSIFQSGQVDKNMTSITASRILGNYEIPQMSYNPWNGTSSNPFYTVPFWNGMKSHQARKPNSIKPLNPPNRSALNRRNEAI